VRVRITATPVEKEVDGIPLGIFVPGTVRNVSSSLGLWLIAQGYAQAEMREEHTSPSGSPQADRSDDGHRYSDRRKKRS
jgi:hypothetical protein